ncbi:uncharacterized protein [Diadema antillarum]|uniref:uncharacterized protein n=1 Tax=Diadema antillarum TaxID=105358 RepID=UPI003A89E722
MSISTPISEQINGTVLCLLYEGLPSADSIDEIARRSMTISVGPELTTISDDLTSQQTSQEAMSSTAGTMSRGTAPSTSVEVSDGAVSVGTEATAGKTSSGSEQPTTGTASINTTTEASGVPKDIKLGAIIGGVVGGVVLIIIIIVIIMVFLRRPADDVEQNIKRRSKKKQNVNGSKKHRSAILSLRHKLPLFSRPYESDEEDGNDGEHVKTDNDVDTLIMDSQPRSKIASQIRVDLEIDDGGQGTIENGFVPSQLDAKTNLEGYEEGRLGITSHGTFAATNSDDPKSDETDQDVTAETNVDGDYSAVEKRNKPGDTAFGNVVYGSFSVPVHKEEKDEDKRDDAPKSNQDSLNEEQEKDLKSDDGQGEAVVKNDAAEDDALPPPPPPLFDDNVAD